MKTFKGWDVYTHNYEYDEGKIIAMLYKSLVDRDWYPDWEDIMKVGHWIYEDYCSLLNGNLFDGYQEWMNIEDREEEAYIQAWFSRTVEDWIDFYKNNLRY